MRVSIPRVDGRGSGLGNTLIPWAKAYLAGVELKVDLLPPALGLNRRGYREYFDTSRFDWLTNRALQAALPRFTFTESDYRATNVEEFGAAVRVWADRIRLDRQRNFALICEGMWGGFESLRRARPFVKHQLLGATNSLENLYRIDGRLDPNKITVAMHVRLGDFKPANPADDYRGKFNVSLPLDWYISIGQRLQSALGQRVQFLLVTDGKPEQIANILAALNPITTFDLRHTVCSDLLALAESDLVVCSISSFSLWAVFLSDSPYIWFAPQMTERNGSLSIWESPHDGADTGRGAAVGLDGAIPDHLLGVLSDRLRLKNAMGDVVRSGRVRRP